jgi:hypothetical protein
MAALIFGLDPSDRMAMLIFGLDSSDRIATLIFGLEYDRRRSWRSLRAFDLQG